ncbi:MAG TPA: DUF6569 family protein [Methanobacteriaceae archaeon]|nr:DUF6569 family protein [Methanobacteriaceae archaeon]
MNFRVILVVFLIVIFAVGMGAANFAAMGAVNLEKAQSDGKVEIIQNTAAGTVPHTVIIKNNGTQAVTVTKGQLLNNPSSQDLVVAEDITISAGSNSTVKAYCTEPDQKAVPGAKLTANQTANTMVLAIITTSTPSDPSSARSAQLEIWNLKKGGEVDPYTGEAQAMVQSSKSTYYQLKQDLAAAKTNVTSQFGLTNETLKTAENLANPQVTSGMDELRNWFKNTLGI